MNQTSDCGSRRDFLKTSAAATVGAAVGTTLALAPAVHAAGSDTIKVGLIGCGGRGRGAGGDVLSADRATKLVAMADMFKDRLEPCRSGLKGEFGERVDVPDANCFVGFNGYKELLASGVDYIILATPPGFRPMHLKAAVDAGKTIFTEKPVAVDGPGIRTCLEAYEASLKKGLGIAAGTQRRHQTSYLEWMSRIHDGAIGQIVAARAYWNQGRLWEKVRTPEMSEMEWQLRNWYYYAWLCGDHHVEQHVHNLDVINWAMKSHPVRAVAMGGRQVRTDVKKFGHIFDHFAVDYEYEKGVHLMSMSRQIDGCEGNVSEALVGTKGMATPGRITDLDGKVVWQFGRRSQDNKPYVQEHVNLIASLRAGKPINELKNVADSTLTAIMGRMSAYTGKGITWNQALNSKQSLMPAKLEFGDAPIPTVAVPGVTPFA